MDEYNIKNFLNEYSQKTKPLLRSYFKEKIKEASRVGDIPVELLERFAKMAEKGKNIRGALIVLGYRLARGYDMASIYDASTFMEILHAGLLVHDDIMDQDDFRRGLPSIHKQFEKYGKENGKSLAILVGDIAFYLSWDKLLNSNFPNDRLVKAGKIYAKFARNVVYGQALDVINNISNTNQEFILNIFKYKTAEYTGYLPLLIGITLGGVDDRKKLTALEKYGLSLGWAFQIQDDILGLFGSQEKTGKPVGSDLREGKITLLVHYVIKNGNKSQLNYLKTILGNKNLRQANILKAQEFFKKIGAYKHVTDLGLKYVNEGKKSLAFLTNDKNLKNILESLIIYVMNRVV